MKALRYAAAAVLAGVSLMSAAGGAQADDLTNYEITDANLSLAVPTSWAVVTHEGILAHPDVLDDLGIPDYQIEDASTYADAIAPDGLSEIMVLVNDPKPGAQRLWTLDDISDNELLTTFRKQVAATPGNDKYPVTVERVFTSGGHKYVVMSGQSEDSGYYQVYSTFVNGRGTMIYHSSPSGVLTDDQNKLFERIIASTRFLVVTEDPNPQLQPQRQLTAYAIGGIVGRVTGIALIVGLPVWLIVRRRNKTARTQAANAVPPPQTAQADPATEQRLPDNDLNPPPAELQPGT